jgi:hypothetical protein
MSEPEDWPEIIERDAFDGTLPATLPVHWDGPDGPVIGRADVTRDESGLHAVIRIGEPPWDEEERHERP